MLAPAGDRSERRDRCGQDAGEREVQDGPAEEGRCRARRQADHEGIDYERWMFNRIFLLGPAQKYVGDWLQTFAQFPPRQKPGSFNLDAVMAKLQDAASN